MAWWEFWKPKQSVLPRQEVDEVKYEAWYDEKSTLMENVIGPEHEMVVHAIISYEVGGALHNYLYDAAVGGTAVATKQLARADGSGSSNATYDQYEFVMFSKLDLKDRDGVEPLLSRDNVDER